MTKIFRVVVRGQFDDLTPNALARLRNEAADHDFLQSAFTSDGTFTYDDRLVVFNLRYEVRVGPEVPDDAETVVATESVERAARWLDGEGFGHKRLRAEVTDMAAMWHD